MKYSVNEVLQFVQEEDVKFIRLAFCDVFGTHKNISVMPGELPKAFEYGVAIDASAIQGFGDETYSDLYLHPDPDTLSILPWRPEHGKVVRMYCSVTYPDGTPFEGDTRALLQRAIAYAKERGVRFYFGAEMEFYLFQLDEKGQPTKEPYDFAGYMDIAPEDKGENIRREICLILEQMGIYPEGSHHEEGPGQNEIDFRYSDALSAADNAITFRSVVKTIAGRNGLYADFSPKPLAEKAGNGFHINISAERADGKECFVSMIAGILDRVKEITLFLNSGKESYRRLGKDKAPRYISWSEGNRSQLIRIPITSDGSRRAELRSADALANPYLVFALLIYAGMEGIEGKRQLAGHTDLNLYKATEEEKAHLDSLPDTRECAAELAAESKFIKTYVPQCILNTFCEGNREESR